MILSKLAAQGVQGYCTFFDINFPVWNLVYFLVNQYTVWELLENGAY